jgi:hypothetical protein
VIAEPLAGAMYTLTPESIDANLQARAAADDGWGTMQVVIAPSPAS